MEDAIIEIIDGVKRDHIFDAHYVIEKLIREHSDSYFEFIRSNQGNMEFVHSRISRLIGTFAEDGNNQLIRSLNQRSYSHNIRQNASSCKAWIKI